MNQGYLEPVSCESVCGIMAIKDLSRSFRRVSRKGVDLRSGSRNHPIKHWVHRKAEVAIFGLMMVISDAKDPKGCLYRFYLYSREANEFPKIHVD